jgi:hypothetical protein
MSTNEEDELFKECMLNALMNLKSKKKIFRIVIDNSNNFMDYSIFTRKSDEVEFGHELMSIDGHEAIFKWLTYPNRYL